MRRVFTMVFSVLLLSLTATAWRPAAADDAAPRPLRIIAFGAHPDDAEFQFGGTAAKFAALGHKVKLVSATNGDIGHWKMFGKPLAERRTAEVMEAAKRLGVTTEVLDIHDGEIMPTLENRKTIARLIRNWQADIVLTHRPNDYHPDHRNIGLLVRDAAFMVRVPFYTPDSKPLDHNPVFLYFPDNFTKPNKFEADIAVSVDDVFDQKVHAVDALESQVYEGGALGSEQTLVDKQAGDPVARKEILRRTWERRQGALAERFRETLISFYGEEQGKAVKYCEAFEVCEYGSRPTRDELKKLFPFFEAADK
ncbi:PIG-L deacetylase family protein [Lignipirellula cremea]|uniref:Mycothiol S-conjugate amidase n=1 Tax=Lignipirellula cremea TaxID=2528010 RepID=A0A518DQS7_9BACT|nr:PIG-L family deacetylase [Lignipirellula cremea]QDU94196.1 Mycothiol S-conjugate amidase [Lignipirellula cremea]